jgi:hypothetical protein
VVPSRTFEASATCGGVIFFEGLRYCGGGGGKADPHPSFTCILAFALQLRKITGNFHQGTRRLLERFPSVDWLQGGTEYYYVQDSAVSIATRYGLDGPGIESRWKSDFPHPSRPALGPTQASYQMSTCSLIRG